MVYIYINGAISIYFEEQHFTFMVIATFKIHKGLLMCYNLQLIITKLGRVRLLSRPVDNGQLWRSPNLTGNESDFLPAMQTKLWMQQYRHWLAHNNRPSSPYSWSTIYSTSWETRCLLQILKTHVVGLANSQPASWHQGIQQFQCSMGRTKTLLFSFDTRFD